MPKRHREDLVKIINLIVAASCKNFGAVMTSISAVAASNYQSPLQKLQDELQSEVNSGAVGSSDQAALSSALTDIDASVQGGSAGDPSGGASSPPGDLKSKIENLIAGEVSSGSLTSDQATELQGVFKAAFGGGSAEGAEAAGSPGAGAARHAHHGHHGGGGKSADASSTAGTSTSSADVLQQFLQSLQDSVSTSSPSVYGAAGTSGPASPSSVPPLLVDYQS